jgi:hypothetical protein
VQSGVAGCRGQLAGVCVCSSVGSRWELCGICVDLWILCVVFVCGQCGFCVGSSFNFLCGVGCGKHYLTLFDTALPIHSQDN